MLVELIARVADPPPASFRTVHEPVEVELEPRAHLIVVRRRILPGRVLLLCVQLALGLPERRLAPLPGAQLLGELVTTPVLPESLVLLAVDPLGLGQQLLGDPLVVPVGVLGGVRVQLHPIHRQQPHLHQPRPPAQPQHTREQLRQRPLMPTAKLRDRGMIKHPPGGDHHERHILLTLALNLPRRLDPLRIRVQN